MVEIVKLYLLPGSLSLLMLCVTMAVVLIAVPACACRRAGRRLLFGLVGAYWIFSLPITARTLQEGWTPGDTSAAVTCLRSETCGLVVLGSGAQLFRSGGETMTAPLPQTVLNALAAAKLARGSAGPVIVSGGSNEVDRDTEASVLASLLRQHGIPTERIVIEDQSTTTHEQAEDVVRIAKARGLTALVLVSSPAHLRRAVASIHGMPALGYPASYATNDAWHQTPWLPSLNGWGMTRDAAYEYLAFAYYWGRGWLQQDR